MSQLGDLEKYLDKENLPPRPVGFTSVLYSRYQETTRNGYFWATASGLQWLQEVQVGN